MISHWILKTQGVSLNTSSTRFKAADIQRKLNCFVAVVYIASTIPVASTVTYVYPTYRTSYQETLSKHLQSFRRHHCISIIAGSTVTVLTSQSRYLKNKHYKCSSVSGLGSNNHFLTMPVSTRSNRMLNNDDATKIARKRQHNDGLQSNTQSRRKALFVSAVEKEVIDEHDNIEGMERQSLNSFNQTDPTDSNLVEDVNNYKSIVTSTIQENSATIVTPEPITSVMYSYDDAPDEGISVKSTTIPPSAEEIDQLGIFLQPIAPEAVLSNVFIPSTRKSKSVSDKTLSIRKSNRKKKIASEDSVCDLPIIPSAECDISSNIIDSNTMNLISESTETETMADTGQTTLPTTTRTPPKGWEDIYTLVEELRSDRTAPCDIDGCEAIVNYNNTSPANQRFQILIALMLSSQTKDLVVGAAIRSLQEANVLDVQTLATIDPSVLNTHIGKVGFHNTKTKHIIQASQVLVDKYSSDIPITATKMIRDLPGVGPKMAYVCESAAWKPLIPSGIGVDTHMHRLFNKLKWSSGSSKSSSTKEPTAEQTRVYLQSWLPIDKWSTVNLLWVGFGQEIQQQQTKILTKAIHCSRQADALRLLKRCGLDYNAVSIKMGIHDTIQQILHEYTETIQKK